MRTQEVTSEITVLGGGLAGCCAAIAAARLGRTVTLVNNRPVLGGNSSSEVRVWVCGATGHGTNVHAREGGIMGQFFVENQFRNPEGNPYYWDLVVLEAVRAEPNIRLLLNTDVRELEATGPADDRRIESVTGWTMGSELLTTFRSELYLDCTGDGLVGLLAGADFRIGREAAAEFGESFAPQIADDITLGSTLLFYTKDIGRPVKYVPPSFAKDISTTSIPARRIIKAGDNGCAYWWIEFGGEHDIVHDNEMIRDELQSVIYGIWDHIKNSGQFDADTMTLEWVGSVPGKREYRRFLGDHVLTQDDIMDQVPFHDRVAVGGWSIDLHPPGGMYADEAASKHVYPKGLYHVPFRSLYSRNVGNLLMAGRDISATHVAFGSTRVMATCAVIGEGAGTAAALCAELGISPRNLSERHSDLLVRTLLRQDATVLGLPLDDEHDLVQSAEVSASSTLTSVDVPIGTDRHLLEQDLGIVIPVDPHLDSVAFVVDATEDSELLVTCYDPVLGQNYRPEVEVAKSSVRVNAGAGQRIVADLPFRPPTAGNAFVVLQANPAVSVHVAPEPTPGVLCLVRSTSRTDDQASGAAWSAKPLDRRTVCLTVSPPTTAFAPAKATDGYLRPFAGPHMWVSEPLGTGSAWLLAEWAEPVTLRQVDLVFDDCVHEDLINLHHHRTPFEVLPELVRDYHLEARTPQGDWVLLANDVDNHTRHHRLHLHGRGGAPGPIEASALRLTVSATNGAPSAHVLSLRAYA